MLVIKIELSEIVHLNSADFPASLHYTARTVVRAHARFAVCISHTHVERAKSARQVHPTFANRCRSYILTYGFCVGYQRHASCKSDSPWDTRLSVALSGERDSRFRTSWRLKRPDMNVVKEYLHGNDYIRAFRCIKHFTGDSHIRQY